MGDTKEDRVRFPRRIAGDVQRAPAAGRTSSSSQLPAAEGPSRGGLWGPYAAGLESSTVHYKTGSDWGDRGLGCEDTAPGAPACFLDPGQRARIATSYQNRVNAALAAYLAALTQLRVDEVLKKEPEKTEWLLELVLDVIGMVASGTVVKAMRALRGGAIETVADVTGDAAAVLSAMQGVSDAEVTTAVSTAISTGRRMRPAVTPGAPARPGVALLDVLGESASGIYERLREDALAGLSDAELLVLFDSFRASSGHTIAAYKDAIGDKLKRFEGTNVGKLGVTKEREPGAPWAIDHQTKAFWVKTPLGRRLALYKRAAHTLGDKVPATAGWRDQTPMELVAEKLRDQLDHPFRFVEYVPDEFTEAAVAMHTARWGEAPLEHAMGYHELAQMGAGR
jgi:hypothetical protein